MAVRVVFPVPGVAAVSGAIADAPATRARAGGQVGPAGPGAVDHRGAQAVWGHAAALKAPLIRECTVSCTLLWRVCGWWLV